MAQAKKKTADAPTTVETVETLAALTLTRGDYTVAWRDLPERTQVRMAVKAFNELMQDSTAFSKKDLEGKTDAEIATMRKQAMDARFNSILTGEFRVGGGGARLPAIDRVVQDIATERLKAIAAAKGVAMPKGDVLKSALAKIIAKDESGIRAEAQARIDEAKGLAESLGDIL